MSTLICLERDDSRRISLDPPEIELKWDIMKRPTATDRTPIDHAEAINKLLLHAPFVMNIPTEVENLVQQEPTLEPNKRFAYVATIRYALPDPAFVGGGEADEVGMLTFQAAVENEHITQAIRKVGDSYVASGVTERSYAGVIGDDGTGRPQGCDVPSPKLSWSTTVFRPLGYVTRAYVAQLGSIVGRWNETTFQGHPACTVLCMSVQGSRNYEKKRWELTYSFEQRPTVTGIQIDTITGITKRGYDYLDVHYEKIEDDAASAMIPKAIQVDVLQVIRSADFSGLGIGS